MIELYTIGFTGKNAQQFFTLLENASVLKLIDTRINNRSQLAGFAKAEDLQFFTQRILRVFYEHQVDFAPTPELLDLYRKKQITWLQYEAEYLNLLDMRRVKDRFSAEHFHQQCFLCSEHTADKCHRRLLAEYFKSTASEEVKIIHLR